MSLCCKVASPDNVKKRAYAYQCLAQNKATTLPHLAYRVLAVTSFVSGRLGQPFSETDFRIPWVLARRTCLLVLARVVCRETDLSCNWFVAQNGLTISLAVD